MRKLIKRLVALTMISCLTVSSSIISFAGEWRSDEHGWWYVNDDGHYPTDTWQEISGKYYYFGSDGYMLHSTTTPDGFQVGSDGAWIESAPESQSLEVPEGVTEQEWLEWLEFEKSIKEGGKRQTDTNVHIEPGEAGYDNTGEINICG